MKNGLLVGALGFLLLPAVGLADTIDFSFTGGTVGVSDSTGIVTVTGATITGLTVNSGTVAGAGTINISLSDFVSEPSAGQGNTITTGNGTFGAGKVTVTCTDCDGYADVGELSGPITGSFASGLAALLGVPTSGSLSDQISVELLMPVSGPGSLIIQSEPVSNGSTGGGAPVPDPANLSLLVWAC
jgi:hypothetical protein